MSKFVAVAIAVLVGIILFDPVATASDDAATAHPDNATLLGLIPTVFILGLVAFCVAAMTGKIPGV